MLSSSHPVKGGKSRAGFRFTRSLDLTHGQRLRPLGLDGYSCGLPGGDFPSLRCLYEYRGASKQGRGLACGRLRSRSGPLVGNDGTAVAERNHLDVTVVDRITRGQLCGLNSLSISIQASPFPISDTDYKPRRVPEGVEVCLLIAASERCGPGIKYLAYLFFDCIGICRLRRASHRSTWQCCYQQT